MSRRSSRKPKPLPPTLEEEIAALGPRPELDPAEPWMDQAGAAAQIVWDRRRHELLDKIRCRDAEKVRIVDPGSDASGNYSVSPFMTAKGHVVEVAPRDQRKNANSQFPKRVATQRMIDWYRSRNLLTKRQWRAGDRLWRIWRETGRDPSLIASYSPDMVRGNTDPDRKMIGRTDAVADWEKCRQLCGGLGFGVLVDVVVWDKSASDWAASKRTPARDCATVGMAFLRLGLETLASHFRY